MRNTLLLLGSIASLSLVACGEEPKPASGGAPTAKPTAKSSAAASVAASAAPAAPGSAASPTPADSAAAPAGSAAAEEWVKTGIAKCDEAATKYAACLEKDADLKKLSYGEVAAKLKQIKADTENAATKGMQEGICTMYFELKQAKCK